jgi:uncharacterized cofD-like protein
MKKIVVIGGGTGSFTVLSGLKEYPIDISAIVSMSDDGGSTGILRDELGVLPSGDIRQCLVALSESSKEMRELISYRFEDGSLKGHSFGNLLLSALEKTSGNFSKGVEEAMKILKVKGEVIPVTEDDVRLKAELSSGEILHGETNIDCSNMQNSGVKRVFYQKRAKANPKAIDRIINADLIVIGPGSHYSSIIPHFIVEGIADAIKNSKARVVYIVNLTNKKEHTEGYDVDDYVDSIESYIGKDRIDFVVFNEGKPDEFVLNKYIEQEGEHPLIEFNSSKKRERKYKLIREDLISDEKVVLQRADLIANERSLIRHDSKRLAEALMRLI